MRVYYKGKQIDMEDVTWEILCHTSTYVDHYKDTHIKFPERILKKRDRAFVEVYNVLGGKHNFS